VINNLNGSDKRHIKKKEKIDLSISQRLLKILHKI